VEPFEFTSNGGGGEALPRRVKRRGATFYEVVKNGRCKMLTIEGIYDGKKIQSLKPIPFKTKKKLVITFLNEVSEGLKHDLAADAIKTLRGCDKGSSLTKTLLESRREDLKFEEARWQK
jgi:hypothetical protein